MALSTGAVSLIPFVGGDGDTVDVLRVVLAASIEIQLDGAQLKIFFRSTHQGVHYGRSESIAEYLYVYINSEMIQNEPFPSGHIIYRGFHS